MSEILLEFDHVIKTFGGVTAVNDNTFQVKSGQVVALIGPNGAGKTSTFNCITGMYSPNSGEIRFQGKNIINLKPHQIANIGISRTFQNLQIFNNMSVVENVMVAVKKHQKSSLLSSMLQLPSMKKTEREVREIALQKLELVGLKRKAFTAATDLSFGEQRLLEIARSLALNPELLLLDEPMSGLSGDEVKRMVDLILNLKESGLTIFLIEHDLSTVMKLSDHVIVLEFGSIIAEGTPEEVWQNERVIEAYIGKGNDRQYKQNDVIQKGHPPLLQLENIHTYRGNIHALKGIDLSVHTGELVAIIGANGAGKSTLLGTIAGQFSPRQGIIRFENDEIQGTPAELLAHKGMNLVPERRGMFSELTVEESLRLGAFNRYSFTGISRRELRKINEDIEQMYNLFPRLRERRKQLSGTMSGGEQQMLAIARGLMSNPKLLMLDEPSLGLAPLIVKEIFDTLNQLKQMGTTILLVEQNARAALSLADRAYVLENGSIKFEGMARDLIHDKRIQDAYLSGH